MGTKEQKAGVSPVVMADPETPTLVETGLPGFLQPRKPDQGNLYTEAILEEILGEIESGRTLRQICRSDPRMPPYKFAFRWLNRKKWKSRFMAAKEMATLAMDDTAFDIAEGVDEDGETVLEDTQRSQLKLNTLRQQQKIDNPDRYNEKSQITINGNLNLRSIMDEAQQRALTDRSQRDPLEIEGEYEEIVD